MDVVFHRCLQLEEGEFVEDCEDVSHSEMVHIGILE